VRRVFAEKGFDGTTTRELADAARVSEALLFKHFPNKEALFAAMKVSLNEQDLGRLARIKELESSVSTLVLLVHFLTHLLIEGWTTAEDEPASLRGFYCGVWRLSGCRRLTNVWLQPWPRGMRWPRRSLPILQAG
jgi:AcrR family transcriptional regulator